MTTNSQLLTNEPKRKEKQRKQKLSKQPEQEMDITGRAFSGKGERRNSGGTVQGRRSIISRHKLNRERKNGIGNRGLKELICTTHGHEPSWGCRDADGSMEHRVEENKGEGKMRQL